VGVVVVPREVVTTADVPPNLFLAQRLLYGSAGGAWLGGISTDPAAVWIDQATDRYDPTDEVLMAVFSTSALRTYRVRASLRPPQAFARLRATLN
jgi:hypothetical protein